MLHQAGYSNAIATLGTALTIEHLPILKKLNAKIIVAYDGDSAGINAAIKASILLAQNGFEGGAVIFKEGLDPADMIKNNENLTPIFENNTPFIEFVIKEVLNKYNLKNPHQKQEAFNEIKNFIITLNPITQDDIVNYASQIMQIPKKFFKIRNKNIQLSSNKKIEHAEASIIKTVYENRNYLNEVAEYLPIEIFNTHQYELELLYQENFDNSALLDIVLNDEVKILDYESLISAIKKMLKINYTNELKKLNFETISLEEKAHKARVLREKIKKLEKGIL